MFTFKQFSIGYVELAMRLYRHDKRAFAAMMTTLVVMAGLDGLPFAEDLEDLIDTILQRLGYSASTKQALPQDGEGRARRHDGPDGTQGRLGHSRHAARCVSAPRAPQPDPGDLDRQALGNQQGARLLEIAGPAGSLVKSVGEAADQLTSGRPGGAVQSALPVALQAALKAIDMGVTGMYKDAQRRPVMTVEWSRCRGEELRLPAAEDRAAQ